MEQRGAQNGVKIKTKNHMKVCLCGKKTEKERRRRRRACQEINREV